MLVALADHVHTLTQMVDWQLVSMRCDIGTTTSGVLLDLFSIVPPAPYVTNAVRFSVIPLFVTSRTDVGVLVCLRYLLLCFPHPHAVSSSAASVECDWPVNTIIVPSIRDNNVRWVVDNTSVVKDWRREVHRNFFKFTALVNNCITKGGRSRLIGETSHLYATVKRDDMDGFISRLKEERRLSYRLVCKYARLYTTSFQEGNWDREGMTPAEFCMMFKLAGYFVLLGLCPTESLPRYFWAHCTTVCALCGCVLCSLLSFLLSLYFAHMIPIANIFII